MKNGIATLIGKVQSQNEKAVARQLATSVQGIKGVINNIEVNCQVDRPDSDIKAEVSERLRWDALVDDGLITVDVQKSMAKLSGRE